MIWYDTVLMSTFLVLLYLAGFLGVLLLFIWSTYNSCITKRMQVHTDFSDIAIQMKRKLSLVDTLIGLVREYATHERKTFTDVTRARSALDNAKTAPETARAENMLTSTLRSLFMVAENYPQLQASENYRQLKQELTQTEDRIAAYREEYNRSVQAYNTYIQSFPVLLVASLLGFADEGLFELSPASK